MIFINKCIEDIVRATYHLTVTVALLKGIYAPNSNTQCFTHKLKFNRNKDTSTVSTNAKDKTLFCTTRQQPGTTHTPALCSPRCSNQNQQRKCEGFLNSSGYTLRYGHSGGCDMLGYRVPFYFNVTAKCNRTAVRLCS